MTTDNIIPFNMEIKECYPDGSFLVEYLPTDGICSPILYNLHVPLDTVPPLTNAEIVAYIAEKSPQEHWRTMLAIKNADLTSRQELVGTLHENADSMVSGLTMTTMPRSALSSYETQMLTTSLIVQQILAEMVGATV